MNSNKNRQPRKNHKKSFVSTVGMVWGKEIVKKKLVQLHGVRYEIEGFYFYSWDDEREEIDSFHGTVSKELGTVGEESENIMGYRVIMWV